MFGRKDKKKIDAAMPANVRGAGPDIGTRMDDGTVFAGLSPDTKQLMYVTPEDAPLTMRWKQAMDYAADLDAHGYTDWRVPTDGELSVLFQNRAAIGGFNESGSTRPTCRYWMSTKTLGCVGHRQFNNGVKVSFFGEGGKKWGYPEKQVNSSVRPVRLEPRQ